jgi:hypothetical protein
MIYIVKLSLAFDSITITEKEHTMKKLLLSMTLFAVTLSFAAEYEDCWFYASRSLNNDQHVVELKELLETAAKSHYNGMLLACGLDTYGKWDAARKARLAEVKRLCDANKIELIPIIWSIGYGTMLGYDRNLVAGLPCIDVPYVVKGDTATIVQEEIAPLPNGNFEEYEGHAFKINGWIDAPGKRSFVDTDVKAEGKASIRLENFAEDKHGHARVCMLVKLKKNRQYMVSCKIKTEDFVGSNSVKIQLYTLKGDSYCAYEPAIEPTQDWKEYKTYFSSGDKEESRLYLGTWGAKAGKVWIDDVKLEEMGVTNIIRRPGCPLTVKVADSDRVLVEGQDYEPVPAAKQLLPANPEPPLVLKLTPAANLKDDTKLLISYYHPVRYGRWQFTTCMSEQKVYDLFRQSAREIKEAINPKKWFLSMDEIRAGGTCAACVARNTDMAHILADCIIKQRQFIKEVAPDATIYIWSDMLKGSFEGVWNMIPKDIVISCWYHLKRDISMPFFENLGFKTQGAAYYDVDTLDTSREWLETCNKTKNCTGIMYTSWRNKYKLLADFGNMVHENQKPLK